MTPYTFQFCLRLIYVFRVPRWVSVAGLGRERNRSSNTPPGTPGHQLITCEGIEINNWESVHTHTHTAAGLTQNLLDLPTGTAGGPLGLGLKTNRLTLGQAFLRLCAPPTPPPRPSSLQTPPPSRAEQLSLSLIAKNELDHGGSPSLLHSGVSPESDLLEHAGTDDVTMALPYVTTIIPPPPSPPQRNKHNLLPASPWG